MTDTATVHRGRPRSAEADAAIRQATVDLLVAEGYANLTMSGVAARAGVSTATLYRRWSSKVELGVGVLTARAGENPLPATRSPGGGCPAGGENPGNKARTAPA